MRAAVPEVNEILGVKFPVLDDGHIRVVDYMGSDESIVQAARVSYGKGTKTPSDDRTLVRYLMRNWHTTPFEMCELKLHVRVPMDSWRQWIRHRMASVNEYSTRYSEAIDSQQKTAVDEWRLQSSTNKQGSAQCLVPGENSAGIAANLCHEEDELHRHARKVYDHRIGCGIAREQARKDLPLSTYTEAYWKIDLHNLLHFLRLRMDSHAQLEIRSYADVIGYEIVRRWCPMAWEAFVDYRLSAVSVTRPDVEVSNAIAMGVDPEAALACIDNGREREECRLKLVRLGIIGEE